MGVVVVADFMLTFSQTHLGAPIPRLRKPSPCALCLP